MKFLPLITVLLLMFFSCSQEKVIPIPCLSVYNIQQHNDSIYFSTPDSGVFRFSPDNPESVRRIGGKGRFPIRTIAFSKSGKLLASSYESGVHYVENDSLVPHPFAQQSAWSMKLDEQGDIWLAGLYGIFRQQKDTLIRFSRMSGVHDLAFYGNNVAVAHMNGISLFNKEDRTLVAEYCKGVICWSITRYDSLLIGGGLNLCAVINKDKVIKIPFGPKNNILWSTARNSQGTLYLGTQDGLFSVQPKTGKAKRAGFKGTCIKSLLIDNHGRLWVGRF